MQIIVTILIMVLLTFPSVGRRWGSMSVEDTELLGG